MTAQHYDFHYARREFLGDVRCLVFDLTPKKDAGQGRFLGRIWVEDQDFSIVRLNGTYAPLRATTYYFHMDSWRLNLVPGYWVPAYIYSEEGDFTAGAKNKIAFKAQTRMWGYNLKAGRRRRTYQIRVDSVKDDTPTAQDATPLRPSVNGSSKRKTTSSNGWSAPDLLAPEGDVDKILQTVVNNIEITNNIELPRPVRTRVLTDLSAGNFQRRQHDRSQPRIDRRASRRGQPRHGALARTGAHCSRTQPGQPVRLQRPHAVL